MGPEFVWRRSVGRVSRGADLGSQREKNVRELEVNWGQRDSFSTHTQTKGGLTFRQLLPLEFYE